MQVNEQGYWQLIQNGDKKSFEELFRVYYQTLVSYACQILKDKDEAEEVIQNMFFNIWNKRETIEINLSVKSYLYRAVHNDCLNKIKHGKVKQMYADDYKHEMKGGFEDGSRALQAKELSKQINLAIDDLPEQCGVVFKLSRFENLKYLEIADQLGISVKTVENHIGKALKILRAQFSDYLTVIIWLLLIN